MGATKEIFFENFNVAGALKFNTIISYAPQRNNLLQNLKAAETFKFPKKLIMFRNEINFLKKISTLLRRLYLLRKFITSRNPSYYIFSGVIYPINK